MDVFFEGLYHFLEIIFPFRFRKNSFLKISCKLKAICVCTKAAGQTKRRNNIFSIQKLHPSWIHYKNGLFLCTPKSMLTTYKKTISVSLSAIHQMAYITSLYEFFVILFLLMYSWWKFKFLIFSRSNLLLLFYGWPCKILENSMQISYNIGKK